MVFHAIAFWLLVLAVPLWAYRWFLYRTLALREQLLFRRIIRQRHENTYLFGLRVFAFLVAIALAVLVLVFTLRYFKHGTVELGLFRDLVRSRLYFGVDPIDRTLDMVHYDQTAPIAILTTCLVLAVAFTLVSAALRDIAIIKRLRKKLERLIAPADGPTTTES